MMICCNDTDEGTMMQAVAPECDCLQSDITYISSEFTWPCFILIENYIKAVKAEKKKHLV